MGEVIPDKLLSRVCRATGADAAMAGERLQELWSGYGEVRRIHLQGGTASSVILKTVRPPVHMAHRRGWNTDRSHRRKLRSYAVEMAWYETFSTRCGQACRVPVAHLCEGDGNRWVFVLEDLDAEGYPDRHLSATDHQMRACLAWLANFHGTFLGVPPDGLWKVGTYWHLATRPDELAATAVSALRDAAHRLDARLNQCRFRTLVHGDAKLANFCFRSDDSAVAAVDFQYVGGGCGIKDVAYLLSCLDAERCLSWAECLVDYYFEQLRAVLSSLRPSVDVGALEAEWRALYPVAWADFYRFLSGWAPGHHKLNPYGQRMVDMALASEVAR
ncbi:MAG: phosphotransferase [Myxococcales bacterium]|nr:phosphotransferase [Myxococcales bacterium]MDD9969681.1 phosphotransferase [Myxococcales bacterium]